MARLTIDPEKVAAVIAEIAEEKIAPRYGRLAPGEIREKSGPNDLVTEVDEAVECALKKALWDINPSALFIGEEAASKDPALSGALAGDGSFWIVDPLDGTRNFVNGVNEFGTIVAFVENGEARMGWIYAAPDKKMAIAVKGDGATWAGEPINPKKPAGARLIALRSLGFLPPARAEHMRGVLKEHFDSRPGYCSAYAYIALARGLVDLKISSRIHPWDHVAGALIAAEAGGAIAFLEDGAPYRPTPSVDRLLLGTAPGRDWKAIADVLRR
ncbi:MAG: inositol monophosphatase family protein [Parvularculaceae bacterium]